MKAEDMPPYRHTAERLAELEHLTAQLEAKRQGDYLREKADMKQRELDQQRIKELEAKVAELETELKGHRKWHDAHQMHTHDERIAKLEQSIEALERTVKMLLEPHYH